MLFLFEIFQAHQEVMKKLVDLIGFTSIMEVSDLYPSLVSAYFELSRICLFLSNLSLLTYQLMKCTLSTMCSCAMVGFGATGGCRRAHICLSCGFAAVVGRHGSTGYACRQA